MVNVSDLRYLVDQYPQWIKQQMTMYEVSGWLCVVLPFLDRHNDHLQIYITGGPGEFVLTDDGYILGDLAMSGVNIATANRRAIIDETIQAFGVSINDDNALQTLATSETLAEQLHYLMQTMVALNDLYYLATPYVARIFLEDVTNWLNDLGTPFIPDYAIQGKSNYSHKFDFFVPRSNAHPDRLIQTITKPSREAAESVSFAWIDTEDSRHPDTQGFAMINDQEDVVPPTVIEALANYGIEPVLWSYREQLQPYLIS